MDYGQFRAWLLNEEIAPKSLNCYFLIGPPAVGKSTWVRTHFSDKEYKTISRDDIIEKLIFKEYGLTAGELYAKHPSKEASVAWQKLEHVFQSVVAGVLDKRPQNVIIDMINADSKARSALLRRLDGYQEYKKIAVVFEFSGHESQLFAADLQRAKAANGARKPIDPEYIQWMMRRIKTDPPSLGEGFDEIQSYNRFKEPQTMEEYNHTKYKQWLLDEEEKEGSRLLVEAQLSKYWKFRAARRAKDAKRPWPNKVDREWALAQQEKSQSINSTVQSLFEDELEESEGMLEEILKMMREIKRKRNKMRLAKEAAKMLKPQEKVKKKKSISVPTKPEYGGVKKGFDKKRKQIKGPVVAPGETFGPLEEEEKEDE